MNNFTNYQNTEGTQPQFLFCRFSDLTDKVIYLAFGAPQPTAKEGTDEYIKQANNFINRFRMTPEKIWIPLISNDMSLPKVYEDLRPFDFNKRPKLMALSRPSEHVVGAVGSAWEVDPIAYMGNYMRKAIYSDDFSRVVTGDKEAVTKKLWGLFYKLCSYQEQRYYFIEPVEMTMPNSVKYWPQNSRAVYLLNFSKSMEEKMEIIKSDQAIQNGSISLDGPDNKCGIVTSLDSSTARSSFQQYNISLHTEERLTADGKGKQMEYKTKKENSGYVRYIRDNFDAIKEMTHEVPNGIGHALERYVQVVDSIMDNCELRPLADSVGLGRLEDDDVLQHTFDLLKDKYPRGERSIEVVHEKEGASYLRGSVGATTSSKQPKTKTKAKSKAKVKASVNQVEAVTSADEEKDLPF